MSWTCVESLADCDLCRQMRMGAAALPEPPLWTGLATWYGNEYIGRPMRSGEVYNPFAMTCAVSARLYPFFAGRTLQVCAPWRCIEVVVTDSGDSQAFDDHHIAVDLSMAAFSELAPLDTGVVPVEVWLR